MFSNTNSRRRRRCLAVAMTVVMAAVASGCGCERPVVTPKFMVTASQIKIQPLGGPNYYLKYEFDCRCTPGGGEIEIVETVDGESFARSSFTGTGTSVNHWSLQLMGTFLNDGDVERLDAFKATLKTPETWSTDFKAQTTHTFLEYTGLDGKPVSYAVRYREKPQ